MNKWEVLEGRVLELSRATQELEGAVLALVAVIMGSEVVNDVPCNSHGLIKSNGKVENVTSRIDLSIEEVNTARELLLRMLPNG